jgi:hypothetical protein
MFPERALNAHNPAASILVNGRLLLDGGGILHSGNIQGPFREHSGTIQETFRPQSANIELNRERLQSSAEAALALWVAWLRVSLKEGTTLFAIAVLRVDESNIQRTFRHHSGNIPGTFRSP